MSAEGYVLIITAIFFGIQQLYKMYLEHERNLATIKRDETVAEKVDKVAEKARVTAEHVEDVKVTLKGSVRAQQEQAAKTDDKLDEIHTTTNGMVRKLEDASFVAGVKSETDKKHG